MRREGYIIEEIADYFQHVGVVQSGPSRNVSVNEAARDATCLRIGRKCIKELVRTYISIRLLSVCSGYRERDYHGKMERQRNLQILTMYDRIGVHAIMTVVDKHLRRRFIRTTSASIQGRGTHDLMKFICRDMETDPEGTGYWL